MKKFRMVILFAIIILSLCACNHNSTEDNDTSSFDTQSESESNSEKDTGFVETDSIVDEEPDIIPIDSIEIDQTDLQLKTLGTAVLTAKVLPENTTESYDNITWKSSDESIVTINQQGEVKAVGNGSATVTATVGNYAATCTITVSNPTISTAEELLAINDFPAGVVYEIVADINMAGIKEPSQKSVIYGTIEGNGHRIYNLEYGPLFSEVYQGTIRNLIVECDIAITKKEAHSDVDLSVLTACNSGLIERCVTRGNVQISADYIEVAGIAFDNLNGTIFQCANEINFTVGGTIINPLGVEKNNSLSRVGGIVYKGNASQCYNIGNATFVGFKYGGFGGIAYEPSKVEDCYNYGTAFGTEYGGGIVGANFGTVQNCCNFGEITSGITGHQSGYIIDCYYLESASSHGGIHNDSGNSPEDIENNDRVRVYGLSDAEARLQESYPTLDFEKIWMLSDEGYPILRWQYN